MEVEQEEFNCRRKEIEWGKVKNKYCLYEQDKDKEDDEKTSFPNGTCYVSLMEVDFNCRRKKINSQKVQN